MDLDELKCKLKSVYAADFPQQASSIQKIREMIRELELIKILGMIQIISPTSISCERWFSSLKYVFPKFREIKEEPFEENGGGAKC